MALGLAARSPLRGQPLLSALPDTVPAPADNPTTPEKVALGRLLFWDPILSGNRDIACATCHEPEFGYAEERDLPIGTEGVGRGWTRHLPPGSTMPLVRRNSPSLLNVAFAGLTRTGEYDAALSPLFWDVRTRGLEAQILEPITTLEEMRGADFTSETIQTEIVKRLAGNREYRTRFAEAFGSGRAITMTDVAKALAAFERTLVASNTPFDRYMRGDSTAMTPAQLAGLSRFQGAGCAACHNGPMFSDYKVHVLGVPDNAARPFADAGVRGTYGFRTASLRNLAYTAPYFHSGVFSTLDDVLTFYNSRGSGVTNHLVRADQLDPLFLQVSIGWAREEILDFLTALNDDRFDRTVPDHVPSGLVPGGQTY